MDPTRGPEGDPVPAESVPGGGTKRKTTLEMVAEFLRMVAEFLREAAVLILVFGWLDPFLRDGSVAFAYGTGIAGVSGFVLGVGITLERMRRE